MHALHAMHLNCESVLRLSPVQFIKNRPFYSLVLSCLPYEAGGNLVLKQKLSAFLIAN